jgi:hypothetical protein
MFSLRCSLSAGDDTVFLIHKNTGSRVGPRSVWLGSATGSIDLGLDLSILTVSRWRGKGECGRILRPVNTTHTVPARARASGATVLTARSRLCHLSRNMTAV